MIILGIVLASQPTSNDTIICIELSSILIGIVLILAYFFTGKRELTVQIGREKVSGNVSKTDTKVLSNFINEFYKLIGFTLPTPNGFELLTET
jgi:hypothetical protein